MQGSADGWPARADRPDIQLAIARELEHAKEAARLVVHSVRFEDGILLLRIDSAASSDGLRDTLEDSIALWESTGRGWGEVIAAVPERAELHVRPGKCPFPRPKDSISVVMPRYLEALQDAWRDNE